jgi:hypothetical protein
MNKQQKQHLKAAAMIMKAFNSVPVHRASDLLSFAKDIHEARMTLHQARHYVVKGNGR